MISIAIPCYEMNGMGENCLIHAILSIYNQSYNDFEIVVSDHSKDNKIEMLCKNFEKVRYFRNEKLRGSSSHNINNCLVNCRGEFIKILCQDDYLYDSHSLQKTLNHFSEKTNWLVSTYVCSHDRQNYHRIYTPFLNDNIVFNNSIGTHSCLTIRNKDVIFFDDNLIWYMDCEYYKRMMDKFGNPYILKEPTVVQLIWPGQVTNTLATEEVRHKEFLYLKQKYGG